MPKRIKLDFMVCDLDKVAYVPNPVKIRIIKPEKLFLLGILGESGRELVKNGIMFWFTRELAEEYIADGIAEEVKDER